MTGIRGKSKMSKPITFRKLGHELLSDYNAALQFLQHALRGNDLAHFIEAFALVIEAQGGVGEFAKKTKLSRQSIYNAINNKSLRADSLFEIVKGLGLEFDLVPAKKTATHTKLRVAHGHKRHRALAAA
jgi:DNA-binding phage protein